MISCISLCTILVVLCARSYTSGSIFQQCKQTDDACILASARATYSQLIAGVPEAGVETSDPLHVDIIDGNLSILKYTITDTTVDGFKDCVIDDFKIDISKWTLKTELTCPHLAMYGEYIISGRLIIVPVEGNGTYSITSKTYTLTVESELKKATGKDGVEHLNIKNFKVTPEAKESVVFVFKNLFNGNKELSDAFHKFANENWKEVANLVQGPVFNANLKKITN